MTRRRIVPSVLVTMCVAVAGACGDDGGSGTSASARTGSGGALELSEPLRITGLVEVSGESAAAVDYFDNGFRLAVDEINADGGIGGQEIEYTRVPLPVFDPARAQSQFL
jgi:branched-chain amino acid transport system substrate-binding protein